MNKILKELNCQKKELSLLLVDNGEMQEINKKYLHRDYPTNVIAFSQTEGEFADLHSNIMGDVVISVEKALQDAGEGGLSLEDELDFLAIHGILHLTGYDHEDVSETHSLAMQNKTDELFYLLKGFKIE